MPEMYSYHLWSLCCKITSASDMDIIMAAMVDFINNSPKPSTVAWTYMYIYILGCVYDAI